jgi:hypothetical protein
MKIIWMPTTGMLGKTRGGCVEGVALHKMLENEEW